MDRRFLLLGIAATLLLTNSTVLEARGGSEKSVQEQRNLALPLAKMLNSQSFALRLAAEDNAHLNETAAYLSSAAGSQSEPNKQTESKAYIFRAALWTNPEIQVCWENPEARYASQQKLVQQAVSSTWAAASKLRFTGWKTCPEVSPADQQVIRIVIKDEDADHGPRTLGLGRQLAGVQNGMLLNFTFLHWSPSCQTMLDYCIRGIAVHEFGHAIGFAHEQNRPDTPGECMEAPQGPNGNVLLTPYDPDSVMNYCNRKYNNDGNLSSLDTKAVRITYGQ